MRKALKVILQKPVVIVFLLALQIVLMWLISNYFYTHMLLIYIATELLAMTLVVHIINDDSNSSYKISWIILIILVPAFGCSLYLYIRSQRMQTKTDKAYLALEKHTKKMSAKEAGEVFSGQDASAKQLATYLNKASLSFPYKKTSTKYFSDASPMFKSMLKDLEAAKEFIFLEYFIIAKGDMWDAILEVLIEKAREGLEVRVMYDGTITMGSKLPRNYNKFLESKGIKCHVFLDFGPILSSYYNNRDHRKILVIDGKVAYTGGINLGDEYINKKNVYGYWKDTGLRLEGDASDLMTTMFLQLWNLVNPDLDDFAKYHRDYSAKGDGYVVPYASSPIDKVSAPANTYLDMIARAKVSIRIMSPYFVVGESFIRSLKLAAEKGVDVSIILPYVQDHKLLKLVSQTYYETLIKSGVKIYEYKPGFIHAKSISIDEEEAVVGTINFDFRSFYLNFENAVYLYKTSSIKDLESDFKETIKQSTLITDIKHIKKIKLAFGKIFKLFAPLL